MSVATDVTALARTLAEALSGTVATTVRQGLASVPAGEAAQPIYAGIGAVDLAVEQTLAGARTLPATVPSELTRLQEQVAEQARTLPGTLPTEFSRLQAQLQEQVRTLPATVRSLRETLPDAVRQNVARLRDSVDTWGDSATTLYGELASRGEKVAATLTRREAGEPAASAASGTSGTAVADEVVETVTEARAAATGSGTPKRHTEA